jgi:hypothetical protein
MPSSGWYSKKFNKAALVYEIGVAIYHNKIVWTNGPFPAGQNDKKVFNKPGGLKEKIRQTGKRGVGDEGYVGDPNQCATRNSLDAPDVKEYKKGSKRATKQ